MSGCREIISLQLGHYANFVGAHFWNLQEGNFVYGPSSLYSCRSPYADDGEDGDRATAGGCDSEINHDVLFREGRTPFGQHLTYSPRLIAMDLKGSLQGRLLVNDLYEDEENNGLDPVLSKGSNPISEAVATGHLPTWSSGVCVEADEMAWSRNRERYLEVDEYDRVSSAVVDDDEQEEHSMADHLSSPLGDTKREYHSPVSPAHWPPPLPTSVWSDQLATRYHPRSLLILNGYLHGSEDQPFNSYAQGAATMSKDALEEWEDKLHFFTEECDYLQGFQVLMEPHNGFSGVTMNLLERLEEDFSRKSTMIVPLLPAQLLSASSKEGSMTTSRDRAMCLLNLVTSLGHIGEEWATSVLPLSASLEPWSKGTVATSRQLPNIKPDCLSNVNESSSLLAAALDNLTAPLRYRSSKALTLSLMEEHLVLQNRKLVSASVAMPFPMSKLSSLASVLDRQGPLHFSLNPLIRTQEVALSHSQLCCTRGLNPDQIVFPSEREKAYLLRDHRTVSSVVQLYLNEREPTSPARVFALNTPLRLRQSFPDIFTNNAGSNWSIANKHAPRQLTSSALIQSTNQIATGLEALSEQLDRCSLRRSIAPLLELVEWDEVANSIERFRIMTSQYLD